MKILETIKNTGDIHEVLPDYPQFKTGEGMMRDDNITVIKHCGGDGFRLYDRRKGGHAHVGKFYIIDFGDGPVIEYRL